MPSEAVHEDDTFRSVEYSKSFVSGTHSNDGSSGSTTTAKPVGQIGWESAQVEPLMLLSGRKSGTVCHGFPSRWYFESAVFQSSKGGIGEHRLVEESVALKTREAEKPSLSAAEPRRPSSSLRLHMYGGSGYFQW